MKLYSYWRSTTSFRVRAALNIKGLAYEMVPVDLVAGDQHRDDYLALNPGAGVPTLMLDDGTVLTQSLAIIDYLDTIAAPRLVPDAAIERARVLAAAHTIAMDVHPVNNLRVIGQLKSRFDATPDQAKAWMQYWMIAGFTALEQQLADNGPFCFGDVPDLADLCLVAQTYNARRWDVDLSAFPNIQRVETACLAHPAIAAAHPDQQPDAKVNA